MEFMDEQELMENFPTSKSELITLLKSLFKGYLEVELFNDNRIRFVTNVNFSSHANFTTKLGVKLSEDLANVIGIGKTEFFLKPMEWIDCLNQIDLLANHPYHFIVCCDLCENSVLSGSPVQILKYFQCEKKNETKLDIEFSNYDFTKL